MIKEYFFKIRGYIKKKDGSKDEFNMFMKGKDDRDAVLNIKEFLRRNAPSPDGKTIGHVIIEGIEAREP